MVGNVHAAVVMIFELGTNGCTGCLSFFFLSLSLALWLTCMVLFGASAVPHVVCGTLQ